MTDQLTNPSLDLHDRELLGDVSRGTAYRTAPSYWFLDRLELPVRSSLRLDDLTATGLVKLTDTGTGYHLASLTTTGTAALQAVSR